MVESGTGNVSALLAKLKSKDDGGKGAVFMQKDEGNFTVTVNKSRTAGNDDGKDSDLEVLQEGSGESNLRIVDSEIKDGIDTENVNVSEE